MASNEGTSYSALSISKDKDKLYRNRKDMNENLVNNVYASKSTMKIVSPRHNNLA
jgi:hypothetical protein